MLVSTRALEHLDNLTLTDIGSFHIELGQVWRASTLVPYRA